MSKDKVATESFVKEAVDKAKNEITEAMDILQKDLQSRIEDSETRLEARLNESMDNKLDSKIGQLRSDIFEKLDEISGDIKTFQEEHTVLSMHSSEHYDKLEDHEKRITKLEISSSPI